MAILERLQDRLVQLLYRRQGGSRKDQECSQHPQNGNYRKEKGNGLEEKKIAAAFQIVWKFEKKWFY